MLTFICLRARTLTARDGANATLDRRRVWLKALQSRGTENARARDRLLFFSCFLLGLRALPPRARDTPHAVPRRAARRAAPHAAQQLRS